MSAHLICPVEQRRLIARSLDEPCTRKVGTVANYDPCLCPYFMFNVCTTWDNLTPSTDDRRCRQACKWCSLVLRGLVAPPSYIYVLVAVCLLLLLSLGSTCG